MSHGIAGIQALFGFQLNAQQHAVEFITGDTFDPQVLCETIKSDLMFRFADFLIPVP